MRSHVTSLLQVKIVYYVWTQEETEFFFEVIKEKNIVLDIKIASAGAESSVPPPSSRRGLAGRDVTLDALHAVQWRRQQNQAQLLSDALMFRPSAKFSSATAK